MEAPPWGRRDWANPILGIRSEEELPPTELKMLIARQAHLLNEIFLADALQNMPIGAKGTCP